MMFHVDRVLAEREFDKLVVVLREELERRLKILYEDIIVGSDCKFSHSIFHLEFNVVSPLYYKLQRHLIDWGNRTHHPGLADLKLTKFLDQQGYRYDGWTMDLSFAYMWSGVDRMFFRFRRPGCMA